VSAGSSIGFALVFVLTAWGLSIGFALVMGATRARWRELGPAAERRLAALAVVLPVAIAAAVVSMLVIQSLVGADHCTEHDHHAHLCVAHGAAWGQRPWAVALVAAAAAVLVARLAVLVAVSWRARRAVARLRRTSRSVGDVRLVDCDRPFCFVAGARRPEIFASTAAWEVLDAAERSAMLAHERGHVRHRDVAWRTLLEVVAAFGAPLTPTAFLTRWELATERLRDHDAAAEVGDPTTVASALVRLCKLGASVPALRTVGFPAGRDALDDRVRALLGEAPRGERAARAVALLGFGALSTVLLALAIHAEPIHHVLESLLD
jgi:Zn-dependent protease with chaperone function